MFNSKQQSLRSYITKHKFFKTHFNNHLKLLKFNVFIIIVEKGRSRSLRKMSVAAGLVRLRLLMLAAVSVWLWQLWCGWFRYWFGATAGAFFGWLLLLELMMARERDGKRRRIRVNWCTWTSHMGQLLFLFLRLRGRRNKRLRFGFYFLFFLFLFLFFNFIFIYLI